MNPLNFIERLFNTRALERELSIEKSKSAKFSLKATQLELKINSLSSENDQLRNKIQALNEIHNDPLKFDEPTGTWIGDRSNLRYCAKCKTKDIMSPLQNTQYEWYCSSCDKKFNDPGRPKPKQGFYIPD